MRSQQSLSGVSSSDTWRQLNTATAPPEITQEVFSYGNARLMMYLED